MSISVGHSMSQRAGFLLINAHRYRAKNMTIARRQQPHRILLLRVQILSLVNCTNCFYLYTLYGGLDKRKVIEVNIIMFT